MHILVRSADLLQSSAIYLVIILMIRTVSIIYVLRSTQKALRATLPCGCFLVPRTEGRKYFYLEQKVENIFT